MPVCVFLSLQGDVTDVKLEFDEDGEVTGENSLVSPSAQGSAPTPPAAKPKTPRVRKEKKEPSKNLEPKDRTTPGLEPHTCGTLKMDKPYLEFRS